MFQMHWQLSDCSPAVTVVISILGLHMRASFMAFWNGQNFSSAEKPALCIVFYRRSMCLHAI